MASSAQRVDDALAQYYKTCGRNDYFDSNGVGKFMQFVKKHEFDEDAIASELGDDTVNANDCLFVEMDSTFPLLSLSQNQITNELQETEIFKILQHCYTYGVPPHQPHTAEFELKEAIQTSDRELNAIQRLLTLSQACPASEFVLNWKHIACALRHELYNKIASSFMVIINGDKIFEDINELLEEIRNKAHVGHNEIHYIHQLMQRAKRFHKLKQFKLHLNEMSNDDLCLSKSDETHFEHVYKPCHKPTESYSHCIDRLPLDQDIYYVDADPLDWNESNSGNSTPASPKVWNKTYMLHMDDILESIHKSENMMMQYQLIRSINDEHYDTDNVIVDLNNATVHTERDQVKSELWPIRK
eukprot:553600_1